MKLLFILSIFCLGFVAYEPETMGKRELTTLKSIMQPERVTAFAPVQTVGNSASSTSLNITLSSTTLNNLVVVSIAVQSSISVTSVTDNQSNTYTVSSAVSTGGDATLKAYQAYAVQTTGGVTTVTVNVSSSGAIYACADEYSGNATSSVLDVAGTGSGTGTSVAASTFTPSDNGKLIVATLVAYAAASGGWTAGSGYTLYGQALFAGTYPFLRSQYKLSGTTSETAPASVSYFLDNEWAEIAQAYNAGAAATNTGRFFHFFKP